MDFIDFALLGGMGVWILQLRKQVAEVERNGATLTQLDELTARVRRLEHRFEVADAPRPVPLVVETPVVAEPPLQKPPRQQEIVQEVSPNEPSVSSPSLSERLRNTLGSQEWEMLVGGSLLNKLGALVLVIGIALFLGYSFGHVTPAGRAGMAFLVSTAILGAGMKLERIGRYAVFSRGLIGAGWAALYATAYALYAIPEARIIQNPLAGSLGMIAVAIGMIWHSLRYRAQAVTAVAYFAAFAAMAVAPSSPFAVIAIIPLAASLLYISARFRWHTMALFGLLATYLTCISRGSSDASLADTQVLFLAYWLLFEAFDLLHMKHRSLAPGVDLLFPLNTAFFLGLSYLTWSHQAPQRLWMAAAFSAALFLADSVARAFVRPPSSFEKSDDLTTRLRHGSYEGGFVVAAVLAGLAIVARVPGLWASVGLALEAEIVYLAGIRLESPFLRRMGAGAFALSILRTAWSSQAESKTVILGHETWNWTPPALFHAFLFWANRAIRRPNTMFSSSAVLIAAAVLAAEVPAGFIGTAWILLGLALFEIGLRRKLSEFRIQSYVLFACGAAVATLPGSIFFELDWRALAIAAAALYGCALQSRWIADAALTNRERYRFALGACIGTALLAAFLTWRITPPEYFGLALCGLAVAALELGGNRLPVEMRLCFGPLALAAVAFVTGRNIHGFVKLPAPPVSSTYLGAFLAAAWAAVRLAWRPPAQATEWERTTLRDAIASLACAAGFATVWLVAPDSAVTVLWTVIAVAILETGFTLEIASFPGIALAAFVAIYARVLDFDMSRNAVIAIPCAVAGMYWIWHRFRRTDRWGTAIFWAALLPILLLIQREAGERNMALGWVLVSITLLTVGNRAALADARRQSYLAATLAFGAAMLFDASLQRLWICSLTVCGFYLAQFVARHSAEKRAPAFFSLLGTLLLSSLLFGCVSGGLLTVSWGLQGFALLGCGFAFRERVLRLQGLALLLTCILKLFLYDLRNLEAIYRILSFVGLGLILLCVSWIYSRFREHLRRLL